MTCAVRCKTALCTSWTSSTSPCVQHASLHENELQQPQLSGKVNMFTTLFCGEKSSVCACMCVLHVHLCTHECIFIHTYTYSKLECTHKHVVTHSWLFIDLPWRACFSECTCHICTYIYAYIYIYTYVYIYIHKIYACWYMFACATHVRAPVCMRLIDHLLESRNFIREHPPSVSPLCVNVHVCWCMCISI